MCKSYDLKIRVINYYQNNNVTINKVLHIFNISNGSLFNWIKLNNKKLLDIKKIYTRITKITPTIKCYIRKYVLIRTNFKMHLLLKQINKKFNIILSKSSVYSILNIMVLSYKKIKRKIVIKNRKQYNAERKIFEKRIKNIKLSKIISIDESSFDTQLSPIYGWGIRGKELNKKLYIKYRKRYTLICAISNKKVIHSKLIIGSSNSTIFKEFLIELQSKIGKNMKLLMDNARIHHAKIIKQYIKESKNSIIYNVAYCPEYNPIERVFSKIKKIVREKNNTTLIKLKNNINFALTQLTENELTNYFRKSFKL